MSLVTPPLVEQEHKFVGDREQAEAFLAQAADHLTLDVEADYSKFQQGMTALARAATPPRVTQTRPIDIPVLRG